MRTVMLRGRQGGGHYNLLLRLEVFASSGSVIRSQGILRSTYKIAVNCTGGRQQDQGLGRDRILCSLVLSTLALNINRAVIPPDMSTRLSESDAVREGTKL